MGGGNSLIINELDQKPGDFTESFTEDLIEKSGGIKGVNVIKGINGFDAAALNKLKAIKKPIQSPALPIKFILYAVRRGGGMLCGKYN